jgi:prepilin-type N-terminal cleavage/methylation domain-containing protein/prepilin-type processing-associated H-X9-DG protein
MSATSKSKQVARGFTLVEIIIVIMVISVLVALSIPAVQYAREASRRISCANNLKQLGLALSNYESTFKVYPQGANGGLYSGHVMLLPFLEQTSLYNSLNFNGADSLGGFSDGESNVTVGRTLLGAFCCPSDPDTMKYPTTNYAWNGGLGLQATNFVGGFCSASTRNCRYITSADIGDGLSNTASMSEWKIGHMNSSNNSTVVFRVGVQSDQTYAKFVQNCQNATRPTTEFGSWTKDARWHQGSYGSTILNFNSLPNSLSCYYGDSIDYGDWPATSYHSSGINLLFYDNHVKFYTKSISLTEWQSISTRTGNDFAPD